MDLRTDLLTATERHCAATGMSKARLSTIVINDGKFFKRIEDGGDFTVRTYERFMAYFASHPPAQASDSAA